MPLLDRAQQVLQLARVFLHVHNGKADQVRQLPGVAALKQVGQHGFAIPLGAEQLAHGGQGALHGIRVRRADITVEHLAQRLHPRVLRGFLAGHQLVGQEIARLVRIGKAHVGGGIEVLLAHGVKQNIHIVAAAAVVVQHALPVGNLAAVILQKAVGKAGRVKGCCPAGRYSWRCCRPCCGPSQSLCCTATKWPAFPGSGNTAGRFPEWGRTRRRVHPTCLPG